jgi:cadmium resistance protein CadD (predicted permease)
MGSFFTAARTAIEVWVGTSIEDLIVLTTLFLSSRAIGQPRPRQIVAGWYAGIACLVAISAAAAIGLILVPGDWIGLLGLVALTIGIYKLIETIRTRKKGSQKKNLVVGGVVSIAALAISNGGDNVSVYVPLFRSSGVVQSIEMVAVFAICLAVWCAAASLIGSHKRLVEFIEQYGHWIVPVLYMAVGVLIMVNTGLFTRLF